jgi:hypothetical protein
MNLALPLRAHLSLLLFLLPLAFPAMAEDTASIQTQIDAAIAAGQKQVRIKPGTYHDMPPHENAPHVMLRSIRGLDIDATEVTLVCSRLSRAVDIMQCSDLTVRGLTIDYAPLPMTQGTITGFGPMREWTDVRIHAGYPAPLALTNGWGFLWTSDANTRRIKPGTANRPNQSITEIGGGVWRVAHGVPIFDQAAIGDYLRIPQPVQKASALTAAQCTNLALVGVTVQSSPLHYATCFHWCHGVTLQSCRVVPARMPPGATEPRLFSSVGDGFNFVAITGGLRILDCETESTGDDGIAVYASPMLVYEVAGQRVTLSHGAVGAPLPEAGTRLRFFSAASGRLEEGVVARSTRGQRPAADWTAIRKQLMPQALAHQFHAPFEVELEAAVSARPGDEAVVLDDSSAETIIRGCRIRNSGSRGIVANTSRIRVEDNQIEDTFFPAIHTFAFFRSGGGSGFQEDVRITGNRIARANLGRPRQADFLGSVSVVSWDASREPFGGHRRVAIEGNHIAESFGVDVQVHAATGVVVRGNRFTDSHQLAVGDTTPRKVDNTAAIFLEDIQDALVQSNELIRPGPHLGPRPLSTQNVTDLRAEKAFTLPQP